ncbi:BTB/POZ domain-containing protein [Spatholobus suberectus]|nr:BTB/POZ domain-containing protein [Spatholobus suberectus]
MKRTSEWIFSQEIPSDVNVQVGEASFSLHKFPLVSKCGCIRKLVSESNDADVSFIELSDVPGGAEAFELAAKFCYGINFEINVENIATLRCVAEYLEMTEDYSVGNLVGRTDAYLNEVALKTIAGAVSVLHMSENLLPIAERAKLVSRCIDAIAYIACKESQFCSLARSESGSVGVASSMASNQRPVVDWWAEDMTVLRIDIFQRVIIAMMARGFKQYAIGPILMLYAQKSLRGLDVFGKARKKIEPRQEHEKRVVLETIVSLLPRERNAMSVSFLSMLLRAAIYLETTVACRLDLEKRMAMQLGQAALDDLLIPSYSFTGDTLFDVDTVQRIMTNYLESQTGNHLVYNADDEYFSPAQSDMERVGKLMENYLAEIATDRNLPVPKFTCLAELIPEQSRPTEDGMYRAIDIYLKAHPTLSDTERKKFAA